MTASYSDSWTTVYATDALSGAKLLKPQSVHTIICSPPYWGLRSYLDKGHSDKSLELGTEPTPEAYVQKLVEVFRVLRDVLRDDGTLWLNISSCCAGSWANNHLQFKAKDLVPLPWLVGLALQRDGWYLRTDNIWHKPNPMPSSVKDRPTISHEYMLLFSKKSRYYFDQEAVREGLEEDTIARYKRSAFGGAKNSHIKATDNPTYIVGRREPPTAGRNIRSVWTIATKPFSGSHYACFPPELVYPCVKAGTSEKGVCGECGAPWVRTVEKTGETTQERARENGHADHAHAYGGASQNLDFKGSHWKLPPRESKTVGWQPSCTHNSEVVPATVLDPFMGSGTTAYAARKLGRKSIGFDLDERNLKLIEERLGHQEVLL